jgi:ClpP class serine protease
MPSNRNIDHLITSQKWLIDATWGMAQLSKYLSDIDLIEAGASVSDLGYKAMKQEAALIVADRYAQRWGESPEDAELINHVKMIGVMQPYGGMCSYGASDWAEFLQAGDRNPRVVAHILEIDSGGGAVSAGAMMHEAVKSLKKPVYVLGNMIGSAAYLTAAAADKIYLSSEFAEAGSIGVMLSLDGEFLEWYKANVIDLYSTKSPEKNKEWRSILKGDFKGITQELDETAEIFHSKVLEFRPGVNKNTLKGDMFKASTAIEMGLVDGITNMNGLVEQISKDLNLSKSETASVNTPATIYDEEDDEEMAVIQTQKSDNNMFKFDKLANQLLRVLGISVTSNEAGMDDATDQLEAMEPVANQITKATTDLTAKVADLEGRLTNVLADVAVAKVLAEKVTSLEAKIVTLEGENKTLSDRLLGYEQESSGGNDSNNQLNSLQKFEAAFDGFVKLP